MDINEQVERMRVLYKQLYLFKPYDKPQMQLEYCRDVLKFVGQLTGVRGLSATEKGLYMDSLDGPLLIRNVGSTVELANLVDSLLDAVNYH